MINFVITSTGKFCYLHEMREFTAHGSTYHFDDPHIWHTWDIKKSEFLKWNCLEVEDD